MNANRKYFEMYAKLFVGVGAVVLGSLAAQSPARAQQGADPFQSGGHGFPSGTVQPPAEFDAQAKTVLARSAQRYKALRSLHVEEEIVNAGRFTKKVTADFRAPQNLVVTTDEAKGIKTVAYYEGGNVSTLRDFDNLREFQVSAPVRDAQVQSGDVKNNARLAFGNALGQYLSGFFAGEENVFAGQQVQSLKYVGEGTVNGMAADNVTATILRRNQPTTVTFSIGKQDPLLLKVVQSSTNGDGPPGDYVETYSNQQVDLPQPDSTFKFTPPADAQKVDRFTNYRGIQVKPGDTPLAINGKDIDGKALSLGQYKGKVVLLDFWATWCAPCRAELPNVKAAYAKYKEQGFDVLGVSLDISTEPIKPFVTKESIGWRQVYDGYWNGRIATAYNVRYIPSTILIGRDGKVAAIGVRGATLQSAIETALTAKAAS